MVVVLGVGVVDELEVVGTLVELVVGALVVDDVDSAASLEITTRVDLRSAWITAVHLKLWSPAMHSLEAVTSSIHKRTA